MTMTKEIARVRIARELADLESTIIDASARAANLAATMAMARRECDVHHGLGLSEVMRVNLIQQNLTTASANTARVHDGLRKVSRTVMLPDEECPALTGILQNGDSRAAA